MYSNILRVRKLSVLAEQLLQSQGLGFHCTVLHRPFFRKSVLLSAKKIFKEPDMENYALPSKVEENLGKTVDLEVNFDDVKIGGENRRGRKKRMNRVDKHLRVESQEEEEEPDVTKTKTTKKNLKDCDLLFNSLMINLKSKKLKEKKKKIVLEGKRLVHDAISAGFIPEMIFYSRKSDVEKLKVPDSVQLHKILYKSFKLWTDVVTPQGVVGIFPMPDPTTCKSTNSIPLIIICDNVREPGNLGAIMRVAAGVGCRKLILSKGCVSIWEPKVLRAGAGAHFHLPIVRNMLWPDIESLISEHSKVFLANLNYDTTDDVVDTENEKELNSFSLKCKSFESLPLHCYSSVQYTKDETVLVIGGETHGLCSEAYAFAEKRKGARVFIPMSNGIESLNNSVALGILAYEIKRQLNSPGDFHFPVTENAVSVNDN